MTAKTSAVRARAIAQGYRSGLEERIGIDLANLGVKAEYEQTKIAYTKPESSHTYTPDFVLPNGIIIESKGRFMTADRQKHLLIQKQHPDLDIRFVFSRSATKISPASKTSYADWCSKYGFKYADKTVPEAWVKEKGSKKSCVRN